MKAKLYLKVGHNVYNKTDRIVIHINYGKETENFVITPDFGRFEIHKSSREAISIQPSRRNEIYVS